MSVQSSLVNDPDAVCARRRQTLVTATFAKEPGWVGTLEGPVRYETGDAIVTGGSGERWPIGRARFLESHEPSEGTAQGFDGVYRRRIATVWAKKLTEPMEVQLSGARGMLRGHRGDWLVEYSPGDFAVVASGVFERTYELLPK